MSKNKRSEIKYECISNPYHLKLLSYSLAQEGKHNDQGFPDSAYGMSKVGVTVMSIIQQRELDAKGAEDIVVNAVSRN